MATIQPHLTIICRLWERVKIEKDRRLNWACMINWSAKYSLIQENKMSFTP